MASVLSNRTHNPQNVVHNMHYFGEGRCSMLNPVISTWCLTIGSDVMSKRAGPLSKCQHSDIHLPSGARSRTAAPGDPAKRPELGQHQRPAALNHHRLAYMIDLIAELQDMARDGGFVRLACLLEEAGSEADAQSARPER